MPEVIPGAESMFHEGGRVGALVLHGFTGNPVTVRPLAEAFIDAGFTVSMPRLPGHGTTLEDMDTTGWPEWSAEAERAYLELAEHCEKVVVCGLSMGGTLTCWLAAHHREVAGIVTVNAAVLPYDPALRDMAQAMVDAGELFAESVGSDIADPNAYEPAYAGSPLRPLISLLDVVNELQEDLPNITCPALIINSREDHVVDPVASDHLASLVSGPVERLVLERSYHVATLDYDKDLINEHAVEFARKATAG